MTIRLDSDDIDFLTMVAAKATRNNQRLQLSASKIYRDSIGWQTHPR